MIYLMRFIICRFLASCTFCKSAEWLEMTVIGNIGEIKN